MTQSKTSSFFMQRQVEFGQIDIGGNLHHPYYFFWMEEVEYEMLASLNHNVVGQMDDNLQRTGWPRAEVSMKFFLPLRYRDKVEVFIKITRIRAAAVEYQTDFIRINSDGSREITARGISKTAFCLYDCQNNSNPAIAMIDPELIKRLEVHSQD